MIHCFSTVLASLSLPVWMRSSPQLGHLRTILPSVTGFLYAIGMMILSGCRVIPSDSGFDGVFYGLLKNPSE
ncbi:hypothetical protein LCGC14_0444190 [marine sediment metagenome]|uniref:Uncharacterized protein n=1 Tax=marine sediment metagenome TaxID=412755 RepID=A0A0F9SJJ9_9ZZZZ